MWRLFKSQYHSTHLIVHVFHIVHVPLFDCANRTPFTVPNTVLLHVSSLIRTRFAFYLINPPTWTCVFTNQDTTLCGSGYLCVWLCRWQVDRVMSFWELKPMSSRHSTMAVLWRTQTHIRWGHNVHTTHNINDPCVMHVSSSVSICLYEIRKWSRHTCNL